VARKNVASRINYYALKFLGVLTPDTFIGIQSENRDKHAVSLGDPEQIIPKSMMNWISPTRATSRTYRIRVPLESGIMSSFIATLEVDGIGGYNLSPSLTT
jgi:hypothetical protein